MQNIYFVFTSSELSLREYIITDPDLTSFDLKVDITRRKNRRPGWSSISSYDSDIYGAIKIFWHTRTHMLECVINTRNENDHKPIWDLFEQYLRQQFGDEIIEVKKVK